MSRSRSFLTERPSPFWAFSWWLPTAEVVVVPIWWNGGCRKICGKLASVVIISFTHWNQTAFFAVLYNLLQGANFCQLLAKGGSGLFGWLNLSFSLHKLWQGILRAKLQLFACACCECLWCLIAPVQRHLAALQLGTMQFMFAEILIFRLNL